MVGEGRPSTSLPLQDVDGRDKPGHDERKRPAVIAHAYSSDLTAAAIASGEGSTLSSSGGL
jgi:hypothetical protein